MNVGKPDSGVPSHSRNKLYSSLPWGNGGLPAEPITWIDKGAVKNLFYDRYWAEKVGKRPTPFRGALIMDGGTKLLEE